MPKTKIKLKLKHKKDLLEHNRVSKSKMADEYRDDDYEEEVEEDLEELQEGEEAVDDSVKESKMTKFLKTHHPECRIMYMEEVAKSLPMESYPPKMDGKSKHRSVPYLTLFEKTKVIGFRANQLSQGAVPLVKVPEHVTDVLDIARLELEQRRLPFILARPMPDGTYEHWRLSDLLII